MLFLAEGFPGDLIDLPGHFAFIGGNALRGAGLRIGDRRTGMADFSVCTLIAGTGHLHRFAYHSQAIPGFGKGNLRNVHPGVGHHAAGGHPAVPGDPERRTACPAPDSPVRRIHAALIQSKASCGGRD